MTNSTVLAAPFAGSLVSGLMGIGGLLRDYDAGTIDCDQFVEMAHIIALDAAIAGLAALAGQTLIPIPLLGALVGSLAGKFVASALKDGLGKSESALTARLAKYERYALGQLDKGVPRLHATVGRSVRKPGTPSRGRLRSVRERLAPFAGQYCICGDRRRA